MLIFALLFAILIVNAQVKSNIEQIQGTWKSLNDEGVYLTIVKTMGNDWNKVDYEKLEEDSISWVKDTTSLDTLTFHFTNDCPSRDTNNKNYIIEDNSSPDNSCCFVLYFQDMSNLCYEISLGSNEFHLEFLARSKNVYHYYRMNMKPVRVNKSSIYNAKKELTGMYLSKGDEVEVIKGGGDWIEIKYYGQRIVDGWIKREDIE